MMRDIGAVLQQMGGETVAQGVGGDAFGDARRWRLRGRHLQSGRRHVAGDAARRGTGNSVGRAARQ